jgi:uncharacterized repeat protein (TIGR01451 family)
MLLFLIFSILIAIFKTMAFDAQQNPNYAYIDEADQLKVVLTQAIDQDITEDKLVFTKTIVNARNSFKVGESVTFRFTFQNSGEQTITNIKFIDEFNPNNLKLVQTDNITAFMNTRETASGTVQIFHDNLTNIFGVLAPNSSKSFDLEFVTLRSGSNTCNTANISYQATKESTVVNKEAKICVNFSSQVPSTDI